MPALHTTTRPFLLPRANTIPPQPISSSLPEQSTLKRISRVPIHNGAAGVLNEDQLRTRNNHDELTKAMGEDGIPQTTEIDTIPCAGVRIPHGKLSGLIAWRLVVRLVGTHRTGRSVVTNFILDTGRQHSSISRETLLSLRYEGDVSPGESLRVVIQGVETECVVAEEGDASRLSVQFLAGGSLSLCFDACLGTPVLYVDSVIG
ncbi:hypothetical protein BD779DRAFT_1675077 [Infundibulicybe gibba]|nr:hypothetical protein BD779DRAFT_1675077 [Infundibulicybe gibba]